MKLVIAVINHDDASAVTQALTRAGFSSTRMATTGGFLRAGNDTILIGVDEEKVGQVVDTIKGQAHSRREVLPAGIELGYGYASAAPVEVTVGGATIFVVDIERFERV